MDWLELTVSTNTQGADIVSEALIECGAKGTQIIDRADVPDPTKPNGYWELIDQSLIDNMPEDVQVKAWFALDNAAPERVQALREALRALPAVCGFDLGSLEVSTENAHEQDWSECWKKFYKPFRAGKSLVVKPSWEEYNAQPDDKIIEIDPGMAFGTGTHETTGMCIELVEKYYQGGLVMDLGTGSGILAIAAALMGADSVLAVDIDPVAVKVAKENVCHNHLENKIEVRQGDLLAGIDAVCDFTVANIIADVICMLSEPLTRHLRKDGIFVCSGIIKEREQDVLDALGKAGYEVIEKKYRGEWVAIVSRQTK